MVGFVHFSARAVSRAIYTVRVGVDFSIFLY